MPLLGGIQLSKTISKIVFFSKPTSVEPEELNQERGESAYNDIEENSELELPPNVIVVAKNQTL